MIPAKNALQRLRDGNHRFATGSGDRTLASITHERHDDQSPFAVIIGCSDSRVPIETIFDQGLGDLFVIRVAGNIVASSQIGSVEFAAEQLGARLVMVLGHTDCGAIQATLDVLERCTSVASPNLHSIVNRIKPAVETARLTTACGDRVALARRAVRENIHNSVQALRDGSGILKRLVDEGMLHIVGAEYSLETGTVDIFDGPPADVGAPQR